jgi:hypothetical protein
MRKSILSEKNLVVVLFVIVFVAFSFATEDTKKIEKLYLDTASSATSFDKPEQSKIILPNSDTDYPGSLSILR